MNARFTKIPHLNIALVLTLRHNRCLYRQAAGYVITLLQFRMSAS